MSGREARSRRSRYKRSRYSRSRSRSWSDDSGSRSRSRSRSYRRRSYSRSHSRSPYHGGRSRDRYRRSFSRSPRRSRSDSRERYRRRSQGGRNRQRSSSPRRPLYRRRERSTSPLSDRRRHVGNRDNPTENSCIGIFGLSLYTTETDLKDVYSVYGPMESCQVVYDHQTGRSRGFAFVTFTNVEDASDAKERTDGIEIDGRRIRVDFSITKRAHTPTPGIYMGQPTYPDQRRGERSYSRSRSRSWEKGRPRQWSRSRSGSRT